MAAAPGARRQSTHRRDLPGRRGQSVSVSRLRRAAGQHHRDRAQPADWATGQDFRVGPGLRNRPDHSDLDNPEIVYGSCKGQFSRQNLNTTDEQRYWVGARVALRQRRRHLIYRFQRVSPMEVSPHDQHIVYYGSQYLHRTRDGGVTWEKISPDLTAYPPSDTQERERRAHHARRHGRRGLQHAVLDSRIAGSEGRDLDRIE